MNNIAVIQFSVIYHKLIKNQTPLNQHQKKDRKTRRDVISVNVNWSWPSARLADVNVVSVYICTYGQYFQVLMWSVCTDIPEVSA